MTRNPHRWMRQRPGVRAAARGSAGTCCAIALVWIACLPGVAAADRAPRADSSSTAPPVVPGSVVRVRVEGRREGLFPGFPPIYRGLFVRATAESLWIDRGAAREPAAFGMEHVLRFDGRSGRSHVLGAFEGMGIGSMIGAGIGLVSAMVMTSPSSDELAGLSFFILPVFGFAIGGSAGAVVGAVAGADRWEPVEP